MSLRIVFMGTPEFAVPTLVEIVGRGHEVVAVYTRAPKPGGRRGLDLTPSPIEREARRFALPVFTPATLRTTVALVVCCGCDEAEFRRRAGAIGREPDELRANGAAGLPGEVVDRLQAFAAAGAETAYLQVLDVSDLEHLGLIASEVMPEVGAQIGAS